VYKEEFARMMGNNKAFLESTKPSFIDTSPSPLLKPPPYHSFPGFSPMDDFPRPPPGDLHQVLWPIFSNVVFVFSFKILGGGLCSVFVFAFSII
jgi:hypothetical protein